MGAGSPAFRFSHLLVKNWRTFLRADVPFGSRALVVGPSAAGKTSLLDVIRFLCDLAAPGGGFREAVRRRDGVRRLRCLAARQDSDLGFLVRAGTAGEPAAWEYELHFNEGRRGLPQIKHERLSRRGEDIFLRPDDGDQADPERLARSALECGGLRQPVREFGALLATVRFLHLTPDCLRASAAGSGGGLLAEMADTPGRSRRARLRSVLEVVREAVPRLEQIEVSRDAHGCPRLRALYAHWRPRGAWQGEGQLSDGTLRLIGMLWVALEPGGPLLIE